MLRGCGHRSRFISGRGPELAKKFEPCCDIPFLVGSAVATAVHRADSQPVRLRHLPTSFPVVTVDSVDPPAKRPRPKGPLRFVVREASQTKSSRAWQLELLRCSALSVLMPGLKSRSSPPHVAEERWDILGAQLGMQRLAAGYFREHQLRSARLTSVRPPSRPSRVEQPLATLRGRLRTKSARALSHPQLQLGL